MMYFHARGVQNLIVIKDNTELIFFDLIKQKAKSLDLPSKDQRIVNIERYSAFIAVLYEREIEFI